MRLVLTGITLVLLTGPVWAQPGRDVELTSKRVPTSAPPGQHSPYHAVSALPYDLSAPLQSLPPPLRSELGNPPPNGTGGVIGQPDYNAQILEDGRIVFDSRLLDTGVSSSSTVGPRLFGVFDLTDMLAPQDPYISAKLALLHRTFAQRVAMREEHNVRVMDRALAALPAYLQEIWQHQAWDPATKRHILFALWDECAEGGDELLASGGSAARLQIEEFIQAQLPAGTANAYSKHELRAFNRARTSLATFAP